MHHNLLLTSHYSISNIPSLHFYTKSHIIPISHSWHNVPMLYVPIHNLMHRCRRNSKAFIPSCWSHTHTRTHTRAHTHIHTHSDNSHKWWLTVQYLYTDSIPWAKCSSIQITYFQFIPMPPLGPVYKRPYKHGTITWCIYLFTYTSHTSQFLDCYCTNYTIYTICIIEHTSTKVFSHYCRNKRNVWICQRISMYRVHTKISL